MTPRTPRLPRRSACAFTLVEMLISLAVLSLVLTACMGTFILSMKTMYKDTQRLATNSNLRYVMGQISKETLDASYFYLFPFYTAIDSSVNLTTDPSPMTQLLDAADNDYDKWVAHGDCLVLVTLTSTHRTTDIRQLRIYYRVVTAQSGRNSEAPLRYYEGPDWGEGTAATSNGHPVNALAAELSAIDLNSNPLRARTRAIAARTIGRLVPYPYTPFERGDRYPVFSSESPDAAATNGFIAINMEIVNGTTANNQVSSSSFNYTISPRR